MPTSLLDRWGKTITLRNSHFLLCFHNLLIAFNLADKNKTHDPGLRRVTRKWGWKTSLKARQHVTMDCFRQSVAMLRENADSISVFSILHESKSFSLRGTMAVVMATRALISTERRRCSTWCVFICSSWAEVLCGVLCGFFGLISLGKRKKPRSDLTGSQFILG